MVVLPFALESEPSRELGNVAVRMPERTELGKMDRVLPSGASAPKIASDSPRPASTRIAADAASKQTVVTPEAAPALPADRVKPVVIDSKGTANGQPAQPGLNAPLPTVKPLNADKAPMVGAPKLPKIAAATPAKRRSNLPLSRQRKSKPKPTKVARVERAKPVVKAPPIPKRRTDPNSLKSASPSGYVVQIGAFSSSKSARTQVQRGKKLVSNPTQRKSRRAKVFELAFE